jgi:hypothetical protein
VPATLGQHTLNSRWLGPQQALAQQCYNIGVLVSHLHMLLRTQSSHWILQNKTTQKGSKGSTKKTFQ